MAATLFCRSSACAVPKISAGSGVSFLENFTCKLKPKRGPQIEKFRILEETLSFFYFFQRFRENFQWHKAS